MALKKLCYILLILILTYQTTTRAEFRTPIKHVIQIKTRLKYIEGSPTWLLIIRDEESGRVLPYIYDIKNYDNNFIAFSTQRAYRITNSSLKFDADTVIHNFCGLENGILEGKSIMVDITGALTHFQPTMKCRVHKYNDIGFSIADPFKK